MNPETFSILPSISWNILSRTRPSITANNLLPFGICSRSTTSYATRLQPQLLQGVRCESLSKNFLSNEPYLQRRWIYSCCSNSYSLFASPDRQKNPVAEKNGIVFSRSLVTSSNHQRSISLAINDRGQIFRETSRRPSRTLQNKSRLDDFLFSSDQKQKPREEPKNEAGSFDPSSTDAEKYYDMMEKMQDERFRARRRDPAEKNGNGKSLKNGSEKANGQPQTLWARFKDMYKKYWYVLIPVHGILSVGWYGLFYYLASKGVDVVPLLERLKTPEWILSHLRSSKAGYLAAAFAMYKLATPLRYSATLGITTVAIKRLRALGYIKPVPSRKEIGRILRERRERLRALSKKSKSRLRDRYRITFGSKKSMKSSKSD